MGTATDPAPPTPPTGALPRGGGGGDLLDITLCSFVYCSLFGFWGGALLVARLVEAGGGFWRLPSREKARAAAAPPTTPPAAGGEVVPPGARSQEGAGSPGGRVTGPLSLPTSVLSRLWTREDFRRTSTCRLTTSLCGLRGPADLWLVRLVLPAAWGPRRMWSCSRSWD